MSKKDRVLGEKIEHPSYGVLQISRVSGSAQLFDSSMRHHHFISLSVCEASVWMSGPTMRSMGGKEIVEVYMSESQFARAICSLNQGSGTPCTINHVHGKRVEPPEVENVRGSHKEAIKERLTEFGDSTIAAIDKLRAMRAEKKRPTLAELDSIIGSLERIGTELKSNIPFFFQLFEERMEEVIDKAKVEVEAHTDAVLRRAGMEALALTQSMPTLAIEDYSPTPSEPTP